MNPASSLRQWTIDAFASRPFLGNPACVVEPLDVWPADTWMQALAQENNQSETAFLLRTPDCQSARKRAPLSACKKDPFDRSGTAALVCAPEP